MARTKTEQATAEAMSASAKHRDTCRKCEAGARCEDGEALYGAFTAAMEVWESETRQQSARRSVTRAMATVVLAAALTMTASTTSAFAGEARHAAQAGFYQVETSTAGYEVIYYPPGHAVNAALRYPGAPEPSHTMPRWKLRTYSWIAVKPIPRAQCRTDMECENGVSYVGTFRTEKAAKAFCGSQRQKCSVVPLTRPAK